MINLKRIIALSLCTVMFINGTASSVEATIDNISSLSIGDTDSSNISEQTSGDQDNKNTITWSTSDSIKVGSPFDKMNGVKGYDKDGNDITNLITVSGEVDTSKSGEYLLEYSVTNDQGETIKATRKVIVEDTKTQDVVNQNVTTEDSKDENTAIGEVQSGEETEKNEEVKIVGATFTRTYLSEPFDAKANITATDSNGKDITDLITVEGEVDTNKLGSYELKYSVTDENGKTATLTRKVNVINKNIFNKYIEKVNEETKEKTKELGFSIYLDNNTSKFLVENQSNDELDSTRKDEVVFKIRVTDKDNKEKLLVELLGSDTGDSEKLNSLKELEYSFGDYIEINTENAKERFDIIGEMSGDIKSKVDAETKEDESIKIEDYSDGVDNIDYLSNVRFKITEEGIETVYNDAPIINGLEPMEELTTDRDKLLEGIEVTDDHDAVIPNDKIVITEEKDAENNVIALRYEVADSWGRSISRVRQVLNRNKEEQNIGNEQQKNNSSNLDNELLVTRNSNSSLVDNVITVKGITYPLIGEGQDSETRFTIKFNQNTHKIQILDRNSRLFDNKIKDKYFEIVIYNKYGAEKQRLTINGSDRGDAKKIDDFNGTSFSIGDQIELFHVYSENKLSIAGSIQNADFEYNTGIDPEKLTSARFEITESGLKYLVNNPPVITWKEKNLTITRGTDVDLLADIEVKDDIDGTIKKSTVSVTSYNPNKLGPQTVTYTVKDSWGAVARYERTVNIVSDAALSNTNINIKNALGSQTVFSITFDEIDRRILITNQSSNKLDDLSPNDTAFILRVISKAGITRKEIKLNGDATGLDEAITQLNNYRYNKDDFLEFWVSNPQNAININGEITKDKELEGVDYSNGITEEDYMNNVRFKLEENVLHATYNNKPEIIFEENMIIKRGDEFNPINFIKEIKDDHDTLNKGLVKTYYNYDEVEKVGTFKVRYIISDKWGRRSEYEKDIKVIPKNELEKNSITLLESNNENTEAVLTLYFDDVNKQIKEYIVGDKFISGPDNEVAFKVILFNSEGNKKAESSINFNEAITSEALQSILSEKFEHGDRISVEAYSYDKIKFNNNIYENELAINESETNKPEDNQPIREFKDEDEMKNTRFTIGEYGLTKVYNKAPEISGIDNKFIMKGEEFNSTAGVTVKDDHDGNDLNKIKIEVIGKINNNQVGLQTLTYIVTDSWGRSIQKERSIFVKPLVENNKIILKNSSDEDAFVIGFDFSTMKFTVENKTTGSLDSSNNEREFSLIVYNDEGEVITEVKLLGNDENYIEELNKIKNVNLSMGVEVALWAKDSKKLRIEGNIIKPDKVTEEYSDGIEERDFMENVRFKGMEEGLEVIYNDAPEMTIPERTEEFVIYKGDDYRTNLLDGVTIRDEIDKNIDTNSINIKVKKKQSDEIIENTDDAQQEEGSILETIISESEDDLDVNSVEGLIDLNDITKLGEYEVYYTATDSWGRQISKKSEFILKTSITRNEIELKGYHDPSYNNGRDHTVLKMKFNHDEMKIKITDKSNLEAHSHRGDEWFYKIFIYNENGSLKVTKTLTGKNRAETVLNDWNEIDFKYGDYIQIKAYQAFRVRITGTVRNALDNYNTKIANGDDFQYTRFYITEEGLRSEFVPDELEEKESLLEFVSSDGVPFKIKYNHQEQRISFPEVTSFYNYVNVNNGGQNSEALRINLYKESTKEATSYISMRNDSGVNRDLKRALEQGINDGDYLTFEYINIPSSFRGVRASGNVNPENKNFQEKLSSNSDIQNVRFYFRNSEGKQYLDPVYNYAPKFIGIEDIDIYEEDVSDFDSRKGVQVTDDHDDYANHEGAKLLTFTVSERPNNESGDIVELNGIGKYVYTYTATDSWGRTTTVNRNVYVRPSLFKNRIMLYPKGEAEIPESDNIDQEITPDQDNGQNQEVTPNQGGALYENVNTDSENDTTETKFTTKVEPAFEIRFDNNTNKYIVTNQRDIAINSELGNEVAFEISIYNSSGEKKKTIELTGNDKGTSNKFSELSEIEFQYGDYIKVWSASSKYLIVTGEIDKSDNDNINTEDYKDGIDDDNFMNNVVFKADENGLKALYNKAPEIKGIKDKEILFGEDKSLLDGITVEDDKDKDLTVNNITISENIEVNRIGSYEVTYSITDSWGRSTSQKIVVKVVSKMKNNEIELFANLDDENGNQHKFTLKFDMSNNKFIVESKLNNTSNEELQESEDVQKSAESGAEDVKDVYSEIVISNKSGIVKTKVQLSKEEMNFENALDGLKNINLFNDDIISLYSKDPKNIKIKGNIEKLNGQSFENGFESENQFRRIKFKVTPKGLELIEYEQLIVTFDGNLTIERGDEGSLIEGVHISYSSEVSEGNNFIENVQIEVEDINIFRVGKYTAKYILTDIWGEKIEKTREVTVVERNELEKNKIKLLDSNDKSELLEFYIDTINKNIIPIRNNSTNTSLEGELITLTLYDEAGRTKESINVTDENLNLESLNDTKIEYDYGDLIALSVYNNKNGLSITGNISEKKENYLDGIDDEDNINNVRFKIEENGFKSVYNNAPEIIIKNELVLYKDESPDLYDDIEVKDRDPHDVDISVADVIIETELDITSIGDYTAEYTLQDTWGRETRQVRNITVKSSLENNKIEYYSSSDNKNPIFDISIDIRNKKFVVNKHYNIFRNIMKDITSDSNELEEQIDPSKLYEFTLFNKHGEIKKSMSIASNMNSLDFDQELNSFDQTNFQYGDYISVYAKDNKNGIKITGNIDNPQKINENYLDGIDNPDYMNNVRFRIDEDAMEILYNEAPTVEVKNPDETIEVYAGDTHDYSYNMVISDDHDLDIGPDNISISQEDEEKMNILGEQTIDLIITDSWGRSVSVTRKYNVKSSIDRNIIEFKGYHEDNWNPSTGRDHTVLKMKFDSAEKKIIVSDRSNLEAHSHRKEEFFYIITVYDGSKNIAKQSVTIRGNDRADTLEGLNNLDGLNFEYGDYLEFKAYQAFRVKINGPVRNQLEDYTDGINFSDDFMKTRFIITEAGLKADFRQDSLNENESLIEYIGTNGGTALKIKFNHDTHGVEFENNLTGFYNYKILNQIALKIYYYDASQNNKIEYSVLGKDSGAPQQLKQKLASGFGDNDYIAFQYINVNEGDYGLRVTGKLKVDDNADEDLKNEDFSNGIQNKRNISEVRFYLNKDGEQTMEAVRVGAATIEGTNDIEVLQGSEFNPWNEVNAIDYDGTNLTNRMTVEVNGQRVERRSLINTSRIGLNEVKYEVKNDNGITTTVYRNVSVYTESSIAEKDTEKPPLEQGSIVTEEEITNYLKSLVVASDPEHNQDLSDRIQVTSHNLNPEVPGTYYANYSVTNDFGKTSILNNVQIQVVRTISVTVPTVIPFQVVTNLIDKEADPFVAGMLKLQNNKTSDVQVTVKSFIKRAESGALEIISPAGVVWEELSEEDTMKKMALGMFVQSGINGKIMHTKENPLWFTNEMTTETPIGILPRASNLTTPYEAKLSFTSKHGKNFKGGTATGKFDLVFKFE